MNEVNKSIALSSIRFLTGSLAGSVFPLNKPVITVGHEPANDIVIKDDRTVAGFHARLLWNNGRWSIEKHPLASTVTVNSQNIQQQADLSAGAIIGLGENTSFLFLLTGGDERSSQKIVEIMAQTSSPQSPTMRPSYSAPPSMRRLTGPILRPDATQIAPLSTSGIPSLEVSSNNYQEKQAFALDKQVITIGRDATNDIVINDRTVSGQHVQIMRQGSELILIHPHPARKQTLNGLFYQGRKIRGDESFRQTLAHGDIFRIGDENGSFVTLTYNDGSGMQQEALPPVKPIKLSGSEVTIGRVPGNTLVLAHPQVSGHHARLVLEGGTHCILDLGSTNHVYVNGQLVTNTLLTLGDEIRVGPYRLLYEGTQLTEYNESHSIQVDALHLKKLGNNRITLLNDISISIPPRKFVALVGDSGAGKTTLLNALSGLNPAEEGTVLYNGNGRDKSGPYRNLAAFNTQIGYVPQDDIVHRDLTVRRALYYAARMCLPRDFTREQISQRIDEVLDDVEIKEQRDLLIGRLSGGQRKRVSIALELLAHPSLFFLDEPTSGLDPNLDRKMMFLLRKLADKGHTIILVTHATNNLSACDYVCFLTKGGRLAYFGPPEEAKTFFGKDDFAEIYSCLEPTKENMHIPEEAEVKFRASQDYQRYVAQPLKNASTHRDTVSGAAKDAKKVRRPRLGNAFMQFRLLCMRQLELLKNNRGHLRALIMQAPLVALLLMLLVRFEIGTNIFGANTLVQCKASVPTAAGLLVLPGSRNPAALVDCSQVVTFLQNDPNGRQYASSKGGTNTALQAFIVPTQGGGDAQRVVFLIGFFIIIFGLINGTRAIVKEAAIYRRERSVNLSLLAYMFSKICVLGLIVLLQSAIMLLVVQAFEPFSQGVFLPVLLETYITLALVGLTGVMFGITLSSIGSNEDTVSGLLPLVIIPQVILSGAIIPLKDWFTQVLATVVPGRWALVAIGSSLGLHSDKIDGSKLFGDDPVFHGTLYSIYSATDATQRILLAWAALGAIMLVLICLTGISLKRKDIWK